MQFLGSEKIKPHPTQSDCTAGVETEHAHSSRTCWAGRSRRGCHIWARLSIPASSHSSRDPAGAGLLHSLVSTTSLLKHCHATGKHTQQSTMCRCWQPKGKGLDRQISAKNRISWFVSLEVRAMNSACKQVGRTDGSAHHTPGVPQHYVFQLEL